MQACDVELGLLRVPEETTALPSSCTCSISRVASASEKPNSLRNT